MRRNADLHIPGPSRPASHRRRNRSGRQSSYRVTAASTTLTISCLLPRVGDRQQHVSGISGAHRFGADFVIQTIVAIAVKTTLSVFSGAMAGAFGRSVSKRLINAGSKCCALAADAIATTEDFVAAEQRLNQCHRCTRIASGRASAGNLRLNAFCEAHFNSFEHGIPLKSYLCVRQTRFKPVDRISGEGYHIENGNPQYQNSPLWRASHKRAVCNNLLFWRASRWRQHRQNRDDYR